MNVHFSIGALFDAGSNILTCKQPIHYEKKKQLKERKTKQEKRLNSFKHTRPEICTSMTSPEKILAVLCRIPDILLTNSYGYLYCRAIIFVQH